MTEDRAVRFDDPRLRMTLAGRIAVRIATYLSYLCLIAAAATFLISDIPWLFWIGAALTLFLGDRLIHLHEADMPLSELPKSGTVNVARYTTPGTFAVLEKAFDRAQMTKRSAALLLLKELLGTKEVQDALIRLDVKPEDVKQKAEEFLARSAGAEHVRKPSFVAPRDAIRGTIEKVMIDAFKNAQANDPKFVDKGDLASALVASTDPDIVRLMTVFALEPQDVREALQFSYVKSEFRRAHRIPATLSGLTMGRDRVMRHRVMNRAWTARPTRMLDTVSTDLTDRARGGEVGFLIGHDKEYIALVDALSRPTNANALLVGEAGIGKEAIVSHLAYELTKDRVPAALFDRRLVSLEISSLVAGAPPEELQARVKRIAEEIMLAGDIILYIPDIHNLMKTSGAEFLSAADALLPIVKNDAFPVIGATYPSEFKTYIERRSDFTELFDVIRVEEISESEARRILIAESVIFEAEQNVMICMSAVRSAVALAKKYFHTTTFLPSSAEALLKDALAAAVRNGERVVTADDVAKVVEEKTNIPTLKTSIDEAEKLLHLESTIHERLVDQEEAVKAVSDALREYRSGLSRPGGPIASFLFVGPTGVGKTELAKILSRIQFGSEQAMFRFDMTEYQDKASFTRFIGSPDGATHGALTDAIMEHPYSLVLLDEFEKAYPDILNLFLQVLDDGRLTDNVGRTVDFTNTIVIATSNAHSDLVNESLNKGESMADIAEYLKHRLVDVFRPELLNRFSRIIVFKDLSPADMAKVAEVNLRDFAKTADTQGITLVFDPDAVKEIVRLGYDPAFGARPLRRVIDEQLRAPLAEKMLKKEAVRGGTLRLILKDGALTFVVVDASTT